jgi:hypothetical protein
MDVIINRCNKRELVVTSFQSGISDLKFQVMPTVCLIAVSSIENRQELLALVKEINNIGCVFYLSWGAAADEIHDLVDEVIETGNEAWLEIATTSHKDEDFKDVAWFFLNATYLDQGDFRCLAILDETDDRNLEIATTLLELHTAG